METKQAFKLLKVVFNMPVINKCVGMFDKYRTGKIVCIWFMGEITVVWIEYKTKTVGYNYKGRYV
jgi:hypothetical protein